MSVSRWEKERLAQAPRCACGTFLTPESHEGQCKRCYRTDPRNRWWLKSKVYQQAIKEREGMRKQA